MTADKYDRYRFARRICKRCMGKSPSGKYVYRQLCGIRVFTPGVCDVCGRDINVYLVRMEQPK